MFKNIPENVSKDFMECSRRFQRIFKKIPGNIWKDSGECSKRFWGMFEKIPSNVQKDSGEFKFRFILWNFAYFSANSTIKLRQNKGMFSTLLLTAYLLITNLLAQILFSSTFFFLFSRKGVITARKCRGIKNSK